LPSDIQQQSLHRDIKIFAGMMLQAENYEEANWLWMAFASPADCRSRAAETALRTAARLARQQGFGTIARWIESGVLSAEK
jgi:hypothetical protein